jgi:predicted nucleic acid-binding protein
MIVLDANIVLEVLEERRYCQEVLAALDRLAGQDRPAVSVLTVSHSFYLAEAHKVPLARVEKLIRTFTIFDVLSKDVNWALAHYQAKDFEDALQVAAAIRHKASVFMTLDSALAAKYQKFLKIGLVH